MRASRLRGSRSLGFIDPGLDAPIRLVVDRSVAVLATAGDKADVIIAKWFTTLGTLAEQRTATCEQIKTFNKASLRVYDAHVSIFRGLLKAGVEIEPPPIPPLIARTVSSGGVVGLISVDDGCDGKLPDYDGGVRPIFGAGRLSGLAGLGALGLAPVVAVPWIGRAVILAIAAVGAVFVLNELRKLLTSELADKAMLEYTRLESSRDPQRVELYAACLASGRTGGACTQDVNALLPPGPRPEGGTFFKGLASVMTLGIVGGLAFVVIPRLFEK